jgi:hypothetical protein
MARASFSDIVSGGSGGNIGSCPRGGQASGGAAFQKELISRGYDLEHIATRHSSPDEIAEFETASVEAQAKFVWLSAAGNREPIGAAEFIWATALILESAVDFERDTLKSVIKAYAAESLEQYRASKSAPELLGAIIEELDKQIAANAAGRPKEKETEPISSARPDRPRASFLACGRSFTTMGGLNLCAIGGSDRTGRKLARPQNPNLLGLPA